MGASDDQAQVRLAGKSLVYADGWSARARRLRLLLRRIPRVTRHAQGGASGARHGQRILYHTRRGFDLWNTRYFVVPMDPGDWQSVSRGFASFLDRGTMIVPDPGITAHLEAPENQARLESWIEKQDWQLIRNQDAYPRAWVVHQARFLEPIKDRGGREHERLMEQILYADDVFWTSPGRRVFDPRSMAWIETSRPRSLATYVPGTGIDPAETVAVVKHEPQHVEIDVSLRQPGIVILSDVFYPGWNLTIDGQPAEILRANRLMRGAAVAPARIDSYTPMTRYHFVWEERSVSSPSEWDFSRRSRAGNSRSRPGQGNPMKSDPDRGVEAEVFLAIGSGRPRCKPIRVPPEGIGTAGLLARCSRRDISQSSRSRTCSTRSSRRPSGPN